MKIDKVKYDFAKQRREARGQINRNLPSESDMRKLVYSTQEKYKVSFDAVGVTEFHYIWFACKMFLMLPEKLRWKIIRIIMTPAPRFELNENINDTAKYLIELNYIRLFKALQPEEIEDESTIEKPEFMVWNKLESEQKHEEESDDDDEELKTPAPKFPKRVQAATLGQVINSTVRRNPRVRSSRKIIVDGNEYWTTEPALSGRDIKKIAGINQSDEDEDTDSVTELWLVLDGQKSAKIEDNAQIAVVHGLTIQSETAQWDDDEDDEDDCDDDEE